MKTSLCCSIVCGLLLIALQSSVIASPLVIKGNKFFYESTGGEFQSKGIAYQLEEGVDPLLQPELTRDLKYFKQLNINTIRIYQVDPTQDHSAAMQLLSDAGIYLYLDVWSHDVYINRAQPAYTATMWERVEDMINEFAKYDNVAGFIAGNEVANSEEYIDSAATVKAVVRDMKAYMAEHVGNNLRQVPVGVSISDDGTTRYSNFEFYNCGSEEEAVDFFGLNLYEWCSNTDTFQSSGYADWAAQVSKYYTGPVVLTEFGCEIYERNNKGDIVDLRQWHQIATLFNPNQMRNLFAGGIVFRYAAAPAPGWFGVVNIVEGAVHVGNSFNNLADAYGQAMDGLYNMSSFQPHPRTPPTCPANYPSTLPVKPSVGDCQDLIKCAECVAAKADSDADLQTTLSNTCGGLVEWFSSEYCKDVLTAKYQHCTLRVLTTAAVQEFYHLSGTASACNWGGKAELRQKPSGCWVLNCIVENKLYLIQCTVMKWKNRDWASGTSYIVLKWSIAAPRE